MRYQEEGAFMETLIWGKRVSRVENGRFSYVDFVSFSEIQSNFALQIAFAHMSASINTPTWGRVV